MCVCVCVRAHVCVCACVCISVCVVIDNACYAKHGIIYIYVRMPLWQAFVLSCAISQLNKQLVEQQNAIPAGDRHENGTETTTSDPQLDGVLAHKEKIAKLEDELETAKHEHRKTMDKLKVHLCLYLHMHFNAYVYSAGAAKL